MEEPRLDDTAAPVKTPGGFGRLLAPIAQTTKAGKLIFASRRQMLMPDGSVRTVSVRGRRDHPKTGRNEPCFCGSGVKYKLCHLGKPLPEGFTP